MSRRWVALALACVLAVAVGGFAVWTVSCRAGSPVQALPADVPGGDAYPEREDEAAELDSAVARKLTDIGFDVEPRWGLWESYPEVHDGKTVDRWPHVVTAAVADRTVVTLQYVSGSRWWCSPEDNMLAAYDARTGASRWATRWEGESVHDVSLQPGVPGQVLLRDASERRGGLTSIDVDTGETTWHSDVNDGDATTLVTPEWIIVDSEDDSDSTLRALNPSTGDELWRVGYEPRSAGPVLAGNVVVVLARAADGRSELQAYDVATGTMRWTATSYSYELAGTESVALAISSSSTYDPLEAFDARTGERIWTASFGDPLMDLSVVGDGVLVAVGPSVEQPEDLVLLDPATGTTRWTAPDGLDTSVFADEHVLEDPARLLLRGPGQLTTIDAVSGRVTTTDNDGDIMLASSPAGEVVVIQSGLRVSVLTTGS